jgi:hypothetical protein
VKEAESPVKLSARGLADQDNTAGEGNNLVSDMNEENMGGEEDEDDFTAKLEE